MSSEAQAWAHANQRDLTMLVYGHSPTVHISNGMMRGMKRGHLMPVQYGTRCGRWLRDVLLGHVDEADDICGVCAQRAVEAMREVPV